MNPIKPISTRFHGIIRYSGPSEKVALKMMQDYTQKYYISAAATRENEGFLLTGNDMAKVLKDQYNITLHPDAFALKNKQEMIQAMFYGDNNPLKLSLLDLHKFVWGPENETSDEKILAYADARQAAGSDIDGQPIINITV
jgi:hypothetical protein